MKYNIVNCSYCLEICLCILMGYKEKYMTDKSFDFTFVKPLKYKLLFATNILV